MGTDLTARPVPQLVLQGFRERLHTSFGHIVGRIAGGRGDPLLRPCVDDETWLTASDHVGYESLRAVDDAPEVDPEDALPAILRPKYRAAWLNARIVHEYMHRAISTADVAFNVPHPIKIANITLGCHYRGLVY